MEKLVKKLQHDNPEVSFIQGTRFRWSPKTQTVTYVIGEPTSSWSLLHELSHSLLGHNNYSSDVNLLQKEIAAWEKALLLAPHYNVIIDPSFVEDCLDTYRDWLHKRSTCPQCSMLGVQKSSNKYICMNCTNTWLVSNSRSCRPYRRSEDKNRAH